VDILRVAAGDGRLTPAEPDGRLEAALTARTIGELATLTADLPGGNMRRATGHARASSNHDDDLTARYVIPGKAVRAAGHPLLVRKVAAAGHIEPRGSASSLMRSTGVRRPTRPVTGASA
ncbi:MAG: DUF1707 SHOCT-like domain-containing protein, partial [Streptosporangiaceae bacterium]